MFYRIAPWFFLIASVVSPLASENRSFDVIIPDWDDYPVSPISIVDNQTIKQDDETVSQKKEDGFLPTDPFAEVTTRTFGRLSPSLLQNGWLPTTEAIHYFLRKVGFTKKKIKYDDRLLITDLSEVDNHTGAYTIFLFQISIPEDMAVDPNVTKLIIKGVSNHARPDEEANNLNYLRQQPNILKLHHVIDPNVPLLGLDVLSFWYLNPYTYINQYFEIIKEIPGKSYYLYDDYLMPHIFKKIGRALGEFHYRLASSWAKNRIYNSQFDYYFTTAHHDFHGKNVFYDEESDRVGFIDLETMAKTHKRNVPYWHDIYLFYLREKYLDGSHDNLHQFNDHMRQFVNGYVQAYPDEAQQDLKTDISWRIQTWSRFFQDALVNPQPTSNHSFMGKTIYDPLYFSQYLREKLIAYHELTDNYKRDILADRFYMK